MHRLRYSANRQIAYSVILFLAAFFFITFMDAQAESPAKMALRYMAQEKNQAIRANAIAYIVGCKEPECRQTLLHALNDSYWLVRYRAIKCLKPDAALIDPFMKALKDPNDRVWAAAIDGLAEIGGPARSALAKAISDENPFVRQGAVIALCRIGPLKFSEILSRALKDRDANVRRSATQSVRIEYSDKVAPLLLKNATDPDPDVRVAAFEALLAYEKSRTVSLALKALNDPSENVRKAASDLLHEKLSVADAKIIAKLLNDQNSEKRRLGLNTAMKLLTDGNPDKRLIQMLHTYFSALPECSAWRSELDLVIFQNADLEKYEEWISRISPKNAISSDSSDRQLYLDILKNSRYSKVRRLAAGFLEQVWFCENKNNCDDLAAFLNDEDSVVRSFAAAFAAKAGESSAIPILESLTNDADKAVRLRAYYGLSKFLPSTFDFLSLSLLRDPSKMSVDEINCIADSIYNWAAKSPEKNKAISVLTDLLKSKAPSASLSAINFLLELDKETALLQLEKFIKGKDPVIKAEAMKIARSRCPESARMLLSVLNDENESEEIRLIALNELNDSKIKISDDLYGIIKKENTPQKLKEKIYPRLSKDALMKDPKVCQIVFAGKFKLADLTELENTQLPGPYRACIASNMKPTTDPATIDRLQILLSDKDPAVRSSIATALGKISSSMTLPGLERLLQDTDPYVREEAESAINKINQ